jgi:hypothetical protein
MVRAAAHTRSAILLAAACAAACAAQNPSRPASPSDWKPSATEPRATETAAAGAARAAEPVPAPAASAQDAAAGAKDGGAQAGGAQAGGAQAAGTQAAGAQGPGAGGQEATDPVVARVAGRPVFASELLSQWLYSDSLKVLEQLDTLALGRLVVAEATRLGVKLAPELAESAFARGVKAIEEQIQIKRPGVTLDQYVSDRLGLDPRRYRERLRDDTLRTLLGERVVRGWLLQNEHCFLRVIVVQSEEDSELVRQDLAAGKAFEAVARERSKDESAKQGGRIAPIVRGDTPIGRAAFATEAGQVGGPVHEGGSWLWLLVTRRGTPLAGGWDVLGPAVEASLGEQTVDELELRQWKTAMRERYEVDLTPFLRFVGEPAR